LGAHLAGGAWVVERVEQVAKGQQMPAFEAFNAKQTELG
jgi:hypothetical protein